MFCFPQEKYLRFDVYFTHRICLQKEALNSATYKPNDFLLLGDNGLNRTYHNALILMPTSLVEGRVLENERFVTEGRAVQHTRC